MEGAFSCPARPAFRSDISRSFSFKLPNKLNVWYVVHPHSPPRPLPADGDASVEIVVSGSRSDSCGNTKFERVTRRKWPLIVSGIMFTLGMVFMVEWTPLILHNPSWNMGDDAWGIFRGAHYVGWGYLGGSIHHRMASSRFQGMSVLLAPLAMLSGMLHLTGLSAILLDATRPGVTLAARGPAPGFHGGLRSDALLNACK